MSERGIEEIAGEELTAALLQQLQQSDAMSVAVSGAFQATFCHCREIAFRELLIQKLGISDRDMQLALAKAYRDEAARRRGKGRVQVAQEIPAAIRKP